MGVFDTTTQSSLQVEGDTLNVNATPDFAGGLLVAGASLRVTLEKLKREDHLTSAEADRIYHRFVDDLEAAVMGAQ